MNNIDDWLGKLKVGDMVIVSGGSMRLCTVDIVERLTKTQVIVKGMSQKYSRKNGGAIGGYSYYSTYLNQANDAAISKIKLTQKRRELTDIITDTSFKKVKTEALVKICELLKSDGAEE